jgi:imidazolonepropionase-like amidohydrolase
MRLPELLPLAHRLGVPVLAGTDTAGTIAREVTLLAEHGLEPAAALAAATTTGYRFLGERFGQPGLPAALVTYGNDPREDLAVLSSPSAGLIDGARIA